jgi:hypothetical protein
MIESQKAKIRKGMGPRREATCYQTQSEIVIPAGTILRSDKNGEYRAALGTYGALVIEVLPGMPVPAGFKRVVA